MEIEVKEVEYCKLDVHCVLGEEKIDDKRAEVLALFKKAPVKGFRKGKASLDAIKMLYKNQIDEALKRALAEDAYHNTLFEKNIKAYGAPDFKNALLEKSKFSCDFTMRKKPDFELSSFKDMEIPRPGEEKKAEVLYEEIMQDIRIRFGETVPFAEQDFIQLTDNVILNYKVFDGETHLAPYDAEGEMATVGKSRMPGFDDAILGMKIGETRDFFLTVPADGTIPEIAGKNLKFSVNLALASKIVPMPLNDDLAKKVNKENFTELQEFVMGIATAKIGEIEKAKLLQQVSNRLVSETEIKVPDWLKLSEAQFLANQAGVDWAVTSDEEKAKFLESADKNVKLSLILDKIRDEEPEAQVSDQEVIEMIKNSMVKNRGDINEKLKEMNMSGQLGVLVSRVRDEHTLDFVLKNSKIVD